MFHSQLLFENRKNHHRAMDSLQASLDIEMVAKLVALRMKKKLESEINDLEIALDHANKVKISNYSTQVELD